MFNFKFFYGFLTCFTLILIIYLFFDISILEYFISNKDMNEIIINKEILKNNHKYLLEDLHYYKTMNEINDIMFELDRDIINLKKDVKEIKDTAETIRSILSFNFFSFFQIFYKLFNPKK